MFCSCVCGSVALCAFPETVFSYEEENFHPTNCAETAASGGKIEYVIAYSQTNTVLMFT